MSYAAGVQGGVQKPKKYCAISLLDRSQIRRDVRVLLCQKSFHLLLNSNYYKAHFTHPSILFPKPIQQVFYRVKTWDPTRSNRTTEPNTNPVNTASGSRVYC